MKTLYRFGLTLIVALTPLVDSAHAASARPEVGQVQRLQRTASAVFEETVRPLSPAAPTFFQDLVQTGESARVAIELADETLLTLGENATLLIDEFVYNPGETVNRLTLNVIGGALRFIGGKLEDAAQAQITINTPLGTLGVRGTDVWMGPISWGDPTNRGLNLSGVEVEAGSAEGASVVEEESGGTQNVRYGIVVLSGEATVETPAGLVTLRPGQGTILRCAGVIPSSPRSWDAERIKRALETVTFAGE